MKLNDYVNPILYDLDPDQGIEEEYRKKHDQTFCWKFLRTVSYLDPQSFQDKKMQVFNGNVEFIAQSIHQQAKKKDLPVAAPQEENN